MNNWRLLLLAVVVVVQPIGSFTESNLIDGRECCQRSEDTRLYGHRKADERRSLDVTSVERLAINEERRLRSLHDIREERRYEAIRSPMLTRSESPERTERRNSQEHRLSRKQARRSPLVRTRETREDQNRNRDVSRNILGQNERNSHESRNRDTMDATRNFARISRVSREPRSFEQESRDTMSRLPIHNSRSIEERRVSQNRDTTIHKQEQEGIVRDSRLSTPIRFDNRMQLDDNNDRRGIQDNINGLRRSRFMEIRFNEVRVAQKPVERRERDNRDSRVELRRLTRDTDRSKFETAAEKLQQSRIENTLDRTRLNIRYRSKLQRGENKRSVDTLRNSEERFDPIQERTARNLDRMTTRNYEMSRASSMISRALEKNTHNGRTSTIRADRNEDLDTARLKRTNIRNVLRDRTIESRRIVSGIDLTGSSEPQRHAVRVINQRQESHSTVAARRNVRISGSEERMQVSRLSRDKRRVQERQVLRENREERTQPIEKSQLSRENLNELRDWESSERWHRDNNHLSNNIMSALRADRRFRDNDEQEQKSRRVLSPAREKINYRKLDSRNLLNARGQVRADLRRQDHQRSMERARITRSLSAEHSNDARQTLRISRSMEASIQEHVRNVNADKRKQTRNQDRTIEQRMTRKVVTPQRLDARRTSSTERVGVERIIKNSEVEERGDQDRTQRTIAQRVTRKNDQPPQQRESRLERFRRNRADIRKNERQEMQREERNNGQPRFTSNRRSSEKLGAERRQSRDSSKDYGKVSDVARTRIILAERRQENREAGRDFRINQEARVVEFRREERALNEHRSENRDSLNVRGEISIGDRIDSHLQRDATRNTRDRSLQRQSRDVSIRLNEKSRTLIVPTTRNVRLIRNNERQIRSDMSLEPGNVRRESGNDIRGNKHLNISLQRIHSRENVNDRKLDETSFRPTSAVTFRNSVTQDSDEPFSNWQIVLSTLQAVYLCGLLIQMLPENGNKTKKRTFNWWSSTKHLIKAD